MNTLTDTKILQNWLVPDFEVLHWSGKQHKYCVVIPVINEGKRIINLINRIDELQINKISDIIIIDGGSTDNSLVIKDLQFLGVKGLLLKTSD